MAGFGVFTEGARLLAALGVNDNDLTALGEALFGPNADVPLDVPNLSRLYRNAILLSTLKVSLKHFLTGCRF